MQHCFCGYEVKIRLCNRGPTTSRLAATNCGRPKACLQLRATDLPNLTADHPFIRTRWLGIYIDRHLDLLLHKFQHLLRHHDSEDPCIFAHLRVHEENMPFTLIPA